jgi:transposase InsO family protein
MTHRSIYKRADARRDADRSATRELFDDVEVFYNQRGRHSTLQQISPAAFERRLRW